MSSFLHQTTTFFDWQSVEPSCICLLSYIKPQLLCCIQNYRLAVYVFFPTSNHNRRTLRLRLFSLYMSSFLHQTTTGTQKRHGEPCCICLLSYIKPQLPSRACWQRNCCICLLSYIKPQLNVLRMEKTAAVYVFFPTSNHNLKAASSKGKWLYMSSFLHQTTTMRYCSFQENCCICLLSYIKPQHFRNLRTFIVGCICLLSYIKPQRLVSTG